MLTFFAIEDFKRLLSVLRLMIAWGFFAYIAVSANDLLFEVSMQLTHASLAPPSSCLTQYLPLLADDLIVVFPFALVAEAGVAEAEAGEALEARVAVDSNATVIATVGITGLVGRPAGSLMYANIDGLGEYLMASLSSLLRGRSGATDFLFPVCFPIRPCFFVGREARGGNKFTGASSGASGVRTGEVPPSVAGAKDAIICVVPKECVS